MDTPYKALQMLLAGEDKLDDVMSDIEDLNTKRKTVTDKFARHALANVDTARNILIYDSSDIEHGII
jgi:single-stranded DNA-specific DHH superfamily exonuclease